MSLSLPDSTILISKTKFPLEIHRFLAPTSNSC